MFPLMETLKIVGGKSLNLHFHQKRLEKSYYEIFHKKAPFYLEQILAKQKLPRELHKLNFYYNDRDFLIKISPYFPRKIRTLKLVFDDEISYNLKYTDRTSLEKLREKRFPAEEILIVKHGKITDTSFSNVIFFDGRHWFTPDTPLLEGTQRAKLLTEGKIFLQTITPNCLNRFSHFALINAMLETGESFPISNIIKD